MRLSQTNYVKLCQSCLRQPCVPIFECFSFTRGSNGYVVTRVAGSSDVHAGLAESRAAEIGINLVSRAAA